MRRVGFVGVLCVVGCGPLIPVPMDDGTTTGPKPDDDDDDDDSTTSTTVTTASATVLPSTSTPMTTPATVTAPSTMTAGPIDGCVDLELVGGPVGPGLTAGSTIGATDDFQFCEAGGGGGVTTGGGNVSGGDYVVSWIASTSGLYNFTLVGSDYDTVLGLFPPECGGVQYECNDDCNGVSSVLESYVNAGQEIYIVIDGFMGQEGNFVLNIGTGPSDCSSGTGSGSDNDSADFISTAGE
jgi:hypothetical protein